MGRVRVAIILALLVFGALLAAGVVHAQGGAVAKSAGDTAVQVGNVFGKGGTDGLILYAGILAIFLMFLLGALTIYLLLKALRDQSVACASQNERFAEAIADTGKALTDLATTLAAKNATEIAHQASLMAVLARLEGVLARVDPINLAGGR